MAKTEERLEQLEALYIAIVTENLNGYAWQPKVGRSTAFKFRNAFIDNRLCKYCWDTYGTVYVAEYAPTTEQIRKSSHDNCRCFCDRSRTIQAGTATVNGIDGADYMVKNEGNLPEGYVHKKEAKKKGWIAKKRNLWRVLPGANLYETHRNSLGKLPSASGRIWYEADINYHGGERNAQRLLFSNDGLIFVTYDHYQTYFEIV